MISFQWVLAVVSVDDKFDFPIHRNEHDEYIAERGRRANGEDVPRPTGPTVVAAWCRALKRQSERGGARGTGADIGAYIRATQRLAVMAEENNWVMQRLIQETEQIENGENSE